MGSNLPSSDYTMTGDCPTSAGQDRKVTWGELVRLDQRIGDLLREIKSLDVRNDPDYCAMRAWYGYGGGRWQDNGYKAKVVRLVGYCRLRSLYEDSGLLEPYKRGARKGRPTYRSIGELLEEWDQERAWMAAHPIDEPGQNEVLHTSEAYDLVYDILLYALPPCRCCAPDAWGGALE